MRWNTEDFIQSGLDFILQSSISFLLFFSRKLKAPLIKPRAPEELAAKLDGVLANTGSICLIIGSSFGLSDEIKRACDLRLSVSKLTFPHQMMRVLLLEMLYRCFGILKGTKYHK